MANGQNERIVVHPSVTLSDNYNRLVNKPKLNGITIEGNMTPTSLNILDSRVEKYEEISVRVALSDSFLLVLGEEPKKVKLSEVTVGRFTTTNQVTDIQTGNYIFKEMEGN